MGPTVSFLCSSSQGKEIFPLHRLEDRLPLSQTDLAGPIQSFWTYSRYFHSIQEILARDSFRVLREAVGCQLSLPANLIELQRILIYSEKHGNWYHPAKIEVYVPQGIARFVMNVALTERGHTLMSGEVRALNYLFQNFSYPLVPRVYFFQESVTAGLQEVETQREPLSLFLADWFEGFHEFHLSIDPVDGRMKLVLWDGCPTPTYLTERQTSQVYREISSVLSLYYNPLTFDHIYPWHHGAGDFIVKLDGDRLEVRLVTVRNYGPLANQGEMTPESALLFFFLNLSLRMRLDRLEGVGKIAWAGDPCLISTWGGFLSGLMKLEKERRLSPVLRYSFLKQLKEISLPELTENFSELIDSYNPDAPDLPVIKTNLISHILLVSKIIRQV